MTQPFSRPSSTRPSPVALRHVAAAAAVVAATLVGACARSDEAKQPVAKAPQGVGGVMLADTSLTSPAVAGVIARSQESGEQLVNADTLKQQALGALRSGAFDQTQTLIDQALQLRPDDPDLRRIDELVASFQAKQEVFDADRQEAFDRQMRDVELLQENGFRSYAINAANAARAYLPEDEVEAFPSQPWVQELMAESEKLAHEYEEQGEWLRAMRVWSDLASIERLNPVWKDNLDSATRRVRLLATYAPEELLDLRERTQAEREAVDKLLREDREKEKAAETAADPEDDPSVEDGEAKDAVDPTTQPSTRPGDQADAGEELDDAFKTDWRDGLSGITMTMLRNALEDARQFYVRPVEFRDMLVGGVDAAIAVATTPGLERAFPTLEDNTAREQYVTELKAQRQALLDTPGDKVDRDTAGALLRKLAATNNRTLALPEEVIVSEFADGALSVLDPFTAMIWPSQVAEFKKGTQGNFVGVGIQIRSEESGDLRVVSPLPGGPASESGIRYGDVITHINGKSAHGITDTQAVEVITGEAGTDVTLTIKSEDGTVKDHVLTRRSINVRSVSGWRQLSDGSWDWMVDEENGIGYLKLKNFQSSTAEELSEAVAELKKAGATAMILDLRYNPGGLLQSAVDVADRFLAGGTVVSTKGERDAARESRLQARRQSNDVELPMVVLVNEYSASASEIVSGALKDLDRALIVGERTFGKGSVQMLYKLGGRGDDEAWLKLTTSKYYLPSGTSIHKDEFDTDGWGVEPDVVVDMTPRQMLDSQRARQALDVLRDDGTAPTVEVGEDAVEMAADKALMENDAQLSAALLLLRVQLAEESMS